MDKLTEYEILKAYEKEIVFCKENIVINDCIICEKLFRQITPIVICEECKNLAEVF